MIYHQLIYVKINFVGKMQNVELLIINPNVIVLLSTRLEILQLNVSSMACFIFYVS